MRSRKRILLFVCLGLFAIVLLAASIFLRPLLGFPPPINYARWLIWSRSYKAAVLAQPNSADAGLKHIEWDAWGWAAMDTTEYLVFDPTDALSAASQERGRGKFPGIPCEVPGVKRMEKNWYVVRFYTDEQWGIRNAQDCTGKTSAGTSSK